MSTSDTTETFLERLELHEWSLLKHKPLEPVERITFMSNEEPAAAVRVDVCERWYHNVDFHVQWAHVAAAMVPAATYAVKKTVDLAVEVMRTSYFDWRADRKSRQRSLRLFGADGKVVKILTYKAGDMNE